MTDWLAIINSNLGGLVISALVGVVVASFIQWFQAWRTRNGVRQATASILGNEIASIKLLSTQALKVDKIALKVFHDTLAKGTIMHMTINDVDFPRTIYDRPSIDLTLFKPELGATIAELYRWVNFSDYVKKGVNAYSMQADSIAASLFPMAEPIRAINQDQRLQLAIKNFIDYSNGYINNLERISEMSQEALDGLNRITKIDESKVKGDYFPSLEAATPSEAP